MRSTSINILVFILLLSLVSCSSSKKIDQFFSKSSPYEQYAKRLQAYELDQTALGKDWMKAGQLSLQDSLIVNLPYHETGYISPDKPEALSLRYQVREGQQIYIELTPLSQPESRFFIDVFSQENDTTLALRHSADTLPQLTYEVKDSEWHTVRIQPELLRGGAYQLKLGFEPSLSFPVSGIDSKAVGSFFGAPRDGGVRSHKGIDIFAPKGTPVLAVAEGVVGRTSQSGRGGKVVWLNSIKKRFRLYYAHLDSQAVSPGQRVQPGDTLGFVGNTGNARTTPPHLHFSIYKMGRGAVDPYPFVHALTKDESLVAVDTSEVGMEARTKASLSNIRCSPNTASEIVGTLPQHTYVQLYAKAASWYRVRLAGNQSGYVHESLLEPLDDATEQIILESEDTFFYTHPRESNVLNTNLIGHKLDVLAAHDSLLYVRTAEGKYGWVNPAN